jgi:flavin reductase
MSDAATPTADEFRATIGLFATGVAVVTAQAGDLVHGMTANAITSVSLDPLLILVCVEHDAVMRKVIPEVGSFALSILAADQEHLSRWFADPVRPNGAHQFDSIAHRPGRATGSPLLDGAIAWVECTVHTALDAGDHAIFIGEVRALERSARRDPLLYFASRYRRLLPDG